MLEVIWLVEKVAQKKLKGKAKGVGQRGWRQNRNEREGSGERRNVEETTAREEISAGFIGAESQGARWSLEKR